MDKNPENATRFLNLGSVEGAEPVIAILKELPSLKFGDFLEVSLKTVPYQLYDLIQQRGFVMSYDLPGKDEKVTVHIHHRPAPTH